MPHGRVVLIRHGETAWSRDGRHTGTTDVPLTADGEEAARRLRGVVAGRRFTAVWTSPLARARDTARLAGLRADVDPDLREWDYGAYEGRTTVAIRADRPGWLLWRDGAPGGETPAQVGRRADAVLTRVRSELSAGDVALVAHGHLLRVLTARWLDLAPGEGRLFVLGTASVTELGFEHEWPALLTLNRTV